MKNDQIKTLIEQGIYFIKTIIDSLLPDEKEERKEDDKERDPSND
ncbi:MAG: hypothetical protein U5N56_07960 [Candidatus Marinimicrobia bacterium]|nr:hypothetical protein [Candidatus Neomarinimicrobiota bacterium]